MFKKVFGLMALALATLAPVANAQTAADGTTDSKVTYSEYEFAEEPQAPKVSLFSAGILVGGGSGFGLHADDGIDYGGAKIAATCQLVVRDWVRIAPEIGMNITGNKNYYNFDLNFHEVWRLNQSFNFVKPEVNLYTLTGVGFQTWKGDLNKDLKDENGDAFNKALRLNFGAGADVTIYDHIKLTAEWRYDVAFIGYSSNTVSLGVQYAF